PADCPAGGGIGRRWRPSPPRCISWSVGAGPPWGQRGPERQRQFACRQMRPKRRGGRPEGTSMAGEALGKYATLKNLAFVLATIQFVWLVWFFYTGLGGAQELVARVMSIALMLQILFMYQEDYLYKFLPPIANHIIVAIYVGICLYALYYFHNEFERIAIYAQGSFSQQDFVVGLLVFLLVMELSR